MNDNKNPNQKGGSSENQSAGSGNNEAHGESKPSTPGMRPGIEQSGANAKKAAEQEEADLEQQRKEASSERD